MNKQIPKRYSGFSLVEIMIVISIFAILGILSTRSVFLTLRGSKKSESLVKVRENLNYTLSVIERQIRNSEKVVCPNPSTSVLNYTSSEGINTTFSCATSGTDKYVASGSARLTSTTIEVNNCSFTCAQVDPNTSPVVTVVLEGRDNENQSVERGSVSVQTQISVRNY